MVDNAAAEGQLRGQESACGHPTDRVEKRADHRQSFVPRRPLEDEQKDSREIYRTFGARTNGEPMYEPKSNHSNYL
jgi:hypothetical protein